MIVVRRQPTIRFADCPESRRYYVKGVYISVYLVDLTGYEGNGWCGCSTFAFRCFGDLESGKRDVLRYRCKHIKLAVRFERDVKRLGLFEYQKKVWDAAIEAALLRSLKTTMQTIAKGQPKTAGAVQKILGAQGGISTQEPALQCMQVVGCEETKGGNRDTPRSWEIT